MRNITDWIVVVTAVLVSILILLQARGATLGAGFGGSGDSNTVRRGSDKSLHQITIILAIIFAGSILVSIIR
jgi:preprotein translocase subunit SecG